MSSHKFPLTALAEVLDWFLELRAPGAALPPGATLPDDQADEGSPVQAAPEVDKEPWRKGWQVDDEVVDEGKWPGAPAEPAPGIRTSVIMGSLTLRAGDAKVKGNYNITIRAQNDYNLCGLRFDGPETFRVNCISVGEDFLLSPGGSMHIDAANAVFRSVQKVWLAGTDLIISLTATGDGDLNVAATVTRPEDTYTWRLVPVASKASGCR